MITKHDFSVHGPNPEIPPKCRVHADFFEKFARTFALFPVTRVRNPTEIVYKKLVQMNFFIFGGFFRVDFPPMKHSHFLQYRCHFYQKLRCNKRKLHCDIEEAALQESGAFLLEFQAPTLRLPRLGPADYAICCSRAFNW